MLSCVRWWGGGVIEKILGGIKRYYHKLSVQLRQPRERILPGEYRTPRGPGSEGGAYGALFNTAFARDYPVMVCRNFTLP